ncbi:MAG: hypothetical protein Q4Q24_00575 [Methanobrevibacter ruminantium]|uniref:hypothetical protein n=1 Tax=Methanobrevibacter ruminantium TaxID=83816 RepID=UPI0026F0D714|nr:hypothetical protein [Methanobrevibacter ruminantium]MDO5841749.1 hypothetical protein [Methanobrevibacter ruminantium]
MIEIVKINGKDHLKIGDSYYDSANAELLIRIGENTIQAYENTSQSNTDCEVNSNAK